MNNTPENPQQPPKNAKLIGFDSIDAEQMRIMDLNAANQTGACLFDVVESLSRMAECLSIPKVNLKNVREVLHENPQILELFFVINMALKGVKLMVEGEEWDKVVADSENHLYPPPIIDFLKRIYKTNFKEETETPVIEMIK